MLVACSDSGLVICNPVANFEFQEGAPVLGKMIFESTVQNVRSLLVIVECEVSANGRDLVGKPHAQAPTSNVHLVSTLIPQIAVSIRPEPVPVVVKAIAGKECRRSGTGPEIVIDRGR